MGSPERLRNPRGAKNVSRSRRGARFGTFSLRGVRNCRGGEGARDSGGGRDAGVRPGHLRAGDVGASWVVRAQRHHTIRIRQLARGRQRHSLRPPDVDEIRINSIHGRDRRHRDVGRLAQHRNPRCHELVPDITKYLLGLIIEGEGQRVSEHNARLPVAVFCHTSPQSCYKSVTNVTLSTHLRHSSDHDAKGGANSGT